MSQDMNSDLAAIIGSSKTTGASDNIRHGKYRFVIHACFEETIEIEKGNHRFAFVTMMPLLSEPNPQSEGDRVDYISPQMPGVGPLKDDGMRPNLVGTICALKVDFDGPGSRSAGANVKNFILALFNKRPGEITDAEVASTWRDLIRKRPVKKGEQMGFDSKTNSPIYSDRDRGVNPACGMVIDCSTMNKKKKTPNDKGMYVTKLLWACASPMGSGENTPELVAKRRIEIESNMDDEEEVSSGPSAPQQPSMPSMPANPGLPAGVPAQVVQQPAPVVAPPPPPAPPVVPVAGSFVPPNPWTKHPGAWGATPDQQWFYSDPLKGGNGKDTKSLAQFMQQS